MHDLTITRSRLLRRAAAGGLALTAAGAFAPSVLPASDNDLVLLRLAASSEIVEDAYYARALRARGFTRSEQEQMRRAQTADRRHYTALAQAIGGSTPTAEDFDLTFAANAFSSRNRAASTGLLLERVSQGIYIAAAAALEDPVLRRLAATFAASEASNLSFLSVVRGGAAVRTTLPEPLDVEQATAVLTPFWG